MNHLNEPLQKLVRTVEARMAELGWKDKELCKAANISLYQWSLISRRAGGMSYEAAAKLADAVGLELTLTPKQKPPEPR
jgi:hypothetical protein